MQELGEALRIAFGKFRRKFALQNAAIDRPHLSLKRLSISRDANDLAASVCVTPAPVDITRLVISRLRVPAIRAGSAR
jgi:hypothetical protein